MAKYHVNIRRAMIELTLEVSNNDQRKAEEQALAMATLLSGGNINGLQMGISKDAWEQTGHEYTKPYLVSSKRVDK